jgi:uncharacterized membrane protein YjjP (DUF1212 family)
MEGKQTNKIKEVGSTLLEIGALLMSSGASTGRIRTTINRISEAFGLTTELLVTNRALMLSVSNNKNEQFFSSLKRTSPHGVNFKVVSGISRMSWHVVEEKWDVEQIKKEIARLTSLPHYPRWMILVLVGVAGASFCRLAGGNAVDMLVAFAATVVGLFVRQEAHKMEFNPYLCIYFAAFAASLVSGLYVKFGMGDTKEHAFATAVLFLIPGVPLINSFTDLIDSNILNGITRGINGLMIAFTIALGLLTAKIIYNF